MGLLSKKPKPVYGSQKLGEIIQKGTTMMNLLNDIDLTLDEMPIQEFSPNLERANQKKKAMKNGCKRVRVGIEELISSIG